MALIKGSGKPHAILNGTSANDVLVAQAAFTTINGNGGSDVISTNGGYDVVTVGTLSDGMVLQDGPRSVLETVTLTGQGNSVVGGNQSFTITDSDAGQNNIRLGDGDNSVDLSGSLNNVIVGTGTNDLTFTGGGNTVDIRAQNGIDPASRDTITFAGTDNRLYDDNGFLGHAPDTTSRGGRFVTGGTGGGMFSFTRSNTVLKTAGAYNTVSQVGGTADITPGNGRDTVILTASEDTLQGYAGPYSGSYAVHLSGTGNIVDGYAASLTVDGGAGSNTFKLVADPIGDITKAQSGQPVSSYDVTSSGPFNTFYLFDIDANTITAGGDGARVTITGSSAFLAPVDTPIDIPIPAPPAPPALAHPASSITFGGINNYLNDQGAADLVVTGGAGNGTFTLGIGNDSLNTDGRNNNVTAGAGVATIDAGSGADTIILNGTNVNAVVHGANDKIFFNIGSHGTVTDGGTGLHVYGAPGIANVNLKALAADPAFVVTLTGGVGGYTSAAAAAAAIVSDGAGGSYLTLGVGSGIDFVGLPTVRTTSLVIG